MTKAPRQTARQWIVTHEWMVNPMQQTEWIEGMGILIWLAEVFSSLGTGLYIVSLFLNNWWGALIGWFIIVGIKLPLHIVYLGKPLRFWRCMPPFTSAWRTSWIARGTFFTAVYSVAGIAQMIVMQSAPGTVLDLIVKIVAGFFCVLTALYCGFMMSFCKSVPFWNTGLLPIVIMNAGIADGLALLMGIGMFTGGVDFATMETVTRLLLVGNVVLITTFITSAYYGSATAGFSAKELLVGRAAVPFWIGTIFLGIVVPMGISLQTLMSGGALSHGLMIIAVIAHTIGAFWVKYCILKVGIYEPILPKAKIK